MMLEQDTEVFLGRRFGVVVSHAGMLGGPASDPVKIVVDGVFERRQHPVVTHLFEEGAQQLQTNLERACRQLAASSCVVRRRIQREE